MKQLINRIKIYFIMRRLNKMAEKSLQKRDQEFSIMREKIKKCFSPSLMESQTNNLIKDLDTM